MTAIRSAGVSAMRYDAIVIGAGIVGTACARELALAGRTVAVIERDTVGSGATAAGMGHIVVMDDSPAQIALTHYGQQLWDELAAPDAERHEYARCGTLWIAADDEEMAAIQQKQALLASHGVTSEIVDARQLAELEPNLRPGLAGGLRVTGDSVVYPPRGAAVLLEQARAHGAVLINGEVRSIDDHAVRLADGRVLEADAIVVANGARSTDLLPDLPIRPKKGHLAITDRYPGFARHQLVEMGYVKNAHAADGDSVAFNVQPRPTGQLLIGSSRQFDVTHSAIDLPILERMLAQAIAYMPGLAHLSCVRFWTGFRAATPDGLPLIGPHQDRPGVWLATGHEGLGITTSLSTARILAALMCGQPSPIPADPYRPDRVSAIHA